MPTKSKSSKSKPKSRASSKPKAQSSKPESKSSEPKAQDKPKVSEKRTEVKDEKRGVLTDLNTQADNEATPGHFVEVVSGKHKGRYGVLVEQGAGEDVVVRTRDSDTDRIVVKYGDLRPAESGKR